MGPRRRTKKTSNSAVAPQSRKDNGNSSAQQQEQKQIERNCNTLTVQEINDGEDDVSEREQGDTNNDEDISSDGDDKSSSNGCLHCHRIATQNDHVQVRCYECSRYICHQCHWCHEFQANHEIRVCDRCDAFYCRACDEMDQCDDCGEVVCASCSTLLSCKFCGGGLCEECATACGRCGIVLCNRDAKFAVDCDTCRLSYCLVCLASGGKDPCVRCGHRPSKRMEQLVHLRLKSIYKAFKQSSSNSSGGSSCSTTAPLPIYNPHASSATGHHGATASSVGSHIFKATSQSHSSVSTNSNTLPKEPSTATSARRQRLHHDQEAVRTTTHKLRKSLEETATLCAQAAQPVDAVNGNATGTATAKGETDTNKNSEESFQQEKAKADAAAAALLAELEEEEEAAKYKRSKKKRKKERFQAKRDDTPPLSESSAKNSPSLLPYVKHPPLDESNLIYTEGMGHDQLAGDGREHISWSHRDIGILNDHRKDVVDRDACTDDKGNSETGSSLVDPLEQELCMLVANEDEDGLEKLLLTMRGIPGRAILRKNAKKALKKIRSDFQTNSTTNPSKDSEWKKLEPTIQAHRDSKHLEGQPSQVQAQSEQHHSRPGAVTPNAIEHSNSVARGAHTGGDLLRIISQTHGPKTTTASSTTGGGGRASSRPSAHTNTSASSATPNRSECILNMAPVIVGWVIGKGGQRIRDMMEESGARIWIDQDSMGPNEPRIVYVSGQRKSVESAVRMIQDLVNKAPTNGATPQSKLSTPILESAGGLHGPSVSNVHAKPSSGKAPSLPDVVSDGAVTAGSLPLKPLNVSVDVDMRSASILPSDVKVVTSISPNGESKSSVKSSEEMKHVMTCDPRFVPLLIGRRGWTIKHIQDSSLARVDIDQSVLPRRITISGTKEHVQIAVSMVRDVLSYPQAQLQGSVGEEPELAKNTPDECAKKNALHEGEERVLVIDTVLDDLIEQTGCRETDNGTDQRFVPRTEELHRSSPPIALISGLDDGNDRQRSSPPSSLIMTTDAKSSISVSSSLSSTPEPSLSSSKGPCAPVVLEPATIQPPMHGSYAMGSANAFQSSAFHPPGPSIQTGVMGPFLNYAGGIGSGVEDPRQFFHPHAPSSPFHQRHLPPEMTDRAGMNQQHIGISQHHNIEKGFLNELPAFGINKGLPHTSLFHQAQPLTLPHPLHLNGQYLHQQPQHQGPPLPLQHRMGPCLTGLDAHSPLLGDIPLVGSNAVESSGLWEQSLLPSFSGVSIPALAPSKIEGFSLDAAVDFLQHTKRPPANNLVSETVSSLLRGPIDASHNISGQIISTGNGFSTLGREDSKMVDSLFAPAPESGSDPSLLVGIQGLSLNTVDEEKVLLGLFSSDDCVVPCIDQTSPLFSETNPVFVAARQQPAHSRFVWGESSNDY